MGNNNSSSRRRAQQQQQYEQQQHFQHNFHFPPHPGSSPYPHPPFSNPQPQQWSHVHADVFREFFGPAPPPAFNPQYDPRFDAHHQQQQNTHAPPFSANFQSPPRQQQYHHQQHPTAPSPVPRHQSPPPISQRALRLLPIVRLEASDFADPANQTCSICLDDHEVGDLACRLLCGHVFHETCVKSWLQGNCTCPVCRHEHPTDSPEFERERTKKSTRKPKFSERDLNAQSVRFLKNLCSELKIDAQNCLEKADLVQAILESGKVDVIHSFTHHVTLIELKNMRVGALLELMHQLGVVVNREELVEKSDIIEVLLNSERVVLVH